MEQQKTYTQEEYNEIKVELEGFRKEHIKVFANYLDIIIEKNKLEIQIQSYKWDAFIRGMIAGLGVSMFIYSLSLISK